MPSDDLAQGFDDVKGAHPGVSQDGVCGVAKAEPSDHDVEICSRDAVSEISASAISDAVNRLDIRNSSPSFAS